MKTFIAKYKIKEGSLKKIEEWAGVINSRQDEALQTLKKEGVIFESAFIDCQQGENYLFYVMKCIDIKKVFEVLEKSTEPIDLYHKTILRENLEKPNFPKVLVDLENFPPAGDFVVE
ncbi:MAG: hypothetical protein HQ402_00405 [Parcubacteria group bacterium]|nr:hypothetical protein [Parcubacteria group bacterium]